MLLDVFIALSMLGVPIIFAINKIDRPNSWIGL